MLQLCDAYGDWEKGWEKIFDQDNGKKLAESRKRLKKMTLKQCGWFWGDEEKEEWELGESRGGGDEVKYIYIYIYRKNITLPLCGLACFNSVHPWFKSCHLTHLTWPPLDPRYPPLPFPLENPLYYISQN